jgi:hypothetical protein
MNLRSNCFVACGLRDRLSVESTARFQARLLRGLKMQATTTTQHQAGSASKMEQACSSCSLTEVNVGDGERAMSALAGGVLIAIAPRGFTGWMLKAMGCGLLYRAITGHCFAYQSLGMNTAT